MTIEEILDLYDRSGSHGEWEDIDVVFEEFIALRTKMTEIRVIIKEWLKKHGNDGYLRYLELFNQLVCELELMPTKESDLLSKEESERGCKSNVDEKSGMSSTRDERGKKVRDAY